MGKLSEVSSYVRLTLDKLSRIRADLVRLDDDWHDWCFYHHEALRKWCERNSPPPTINILPIANPLGKDNKKTQNMKKPSKQGKSPETKTLCILQL